MFNNTNVEKKINDEFIENIRDLLNNKLDKKINNNNTNDDFIENIRDLFSILDYEPLLINIGFGNYPKENGNYNYQPKFLLFRKNLILMKYV